MSDICCRICLETDDTSNLISPCLCNGTVKYVHSDCLNQWRSSTINSNSFFECSECKFNYKLEEIYYPLSKPYKFISFLAKNYILFIFFNYGCISFYISIFTLIFYHLSLYYVCLISIFFHSFVLLTFSLQSIVSFNLYNKLYKKSHSYVYVSFIIIGAFLANYIGIFVMTLGIQQLFRIHNLIISSYQNAHKYQVQSISDSERSV